MTVFLRDPSAELNATVDAPLIVVPDVKDEESSRGDAKRVEMESTEVKG